MRLAAVSATVQRRTTNASPPNTAGARAASRASGPYRPSVGMTATEDTVLLLRDRRADARRLLQVRRRRGLLAKQGVHDDLPPFGRGSLERSSQVRLQVSEGQPAGRGVAR